MQTGQVEELKFKDGDGVAIALFAFPFPCRLDHNPTAKASILSDGEIAKWEDQYLLHLKNNAEQKNNNPPSVSSKNVIGK